MEKVLAISPHTDDIELGCGGTIAKLLEKGVDVYHLMLTDARDTLVGHFPEDTNEIQCKNAQRALGLRDENVFLFQFTNKHFYGESRQIFEKLEELKDEIEPDLIIIPSLTETHQDHLTTAEQAITVFRRSTSILAFEQPWNNIGFTPNLFVTLSEEHVKKKMEALDCYETQFYFGRTYMSEELIYSWARTRGIQIDKEFAEAFEVIKLIR